MATQNTKINIYNTNCPYTLTRKKQPRNIQMQQIGTYIRWTPNMWKMCSETLAVREMQKQVAIISLCVHKFAKIIKKAIVMAECW